MRIALTLFAFQTCLACTVADERPNIVLILADDMGYSDLGCYGSEIATPHLDELAAGGLRFTQFYNAGRCCPTRASLLTGLYPHQAGIGQMIDNYAKPIRDRLNSPAYTDRLDAQCMTIAEALRPAGYRTLMSGKWHVGSARDAWPDQRGFDRSFSLIGGAMNYFGPGPQHGDGGKDAVIQLQRDGAPSDAPKDGFYSTDAFADAAVEFLKDHGDHSQPFFLYLAFNAPHWPLHALPDDIAKYRGRYRAGFGAIQEARLAKQKSLGLFDEATPLPPRDSQVKAWHEWTETERDELDLKMAIYAAQVESMDRAVGRVLSALRARNKDQNTLVMFLSDNGGCHEVINRGTPTASSGTRESYTSYGRGWAQVSNTPLRLYKHWMHEGGISTPLIVRWPARITGGGRWIRDVAHIIDVMPTALDVAGAESPSQRNGVDTTPLEGVSLVPLFQGSAMTRKDPLCWEHEGNRAVRGGNWKLVSKFGSDWELYDLAIDRTEAHDLASSHPDRVTAMRAVYDSWAARCGVKDWALTRE